IVVLAQESTSTWMMVNALRETYPDLKVFLEQPVSRLTLLRRRAARIGVWAVFGQVLFMLLVPFMCRSGRKRNKELIAEAGLSTNPPPDITIVRGESVNSEDCIAWLTQERPDVVVVNGTRIISAKVLDACSALFLNTHCGITPAYRGVHGGYWALYKGEPENMGVTVHLVNSGIDTGDIVYQETARVDGADNFLTYPVKQYIAGIPLMRKAIADIASSRLQTFLRTDLSSKLWHHPTIWQYLSAYFTRKVR
ncbi:MAG: formyl transferase, partial [Burkholderiaceae bacterium]